MNTPLISIRRNPLLAAGVAIALLAGCSSAPTKSDGADQLRSKLTMLQATPELATRAPLAIKEADLAVQAAEQPQADAAVSAHLLFIADRKIDIAQAQAESRYSVDQRKALAEQRDAMRLQARTQEADSANRRANVAQADANYQKREATEARSATADAQRDTAIARNQTDIARDAAVSAERDADAARNATADAQRNSRELQMQIDTLQAKVTDRGLVLTLGDVLFTSGTATLNAGANGHLGKLAAFLIKYPGRNTLIEGYTDSIGTDAYNQGLSERRADAVKAYLVRQGVRSAQLTATGKGESLPIGDNTTATGRQQNRRVEVIIENQLVSAR